MSNDEAVLVRTFEAQLTDGGDGRTLETFCVPYGTAARVADPPDFHPYQEAFLRGAFQGATKAPNRVLLDFEHQVGMSGVLGHGVELEERDDGLYGKFRIGEHPDGDKALTLVRDKVLTGLSVMFKPLRSQKTADGVVQRVKVHLDRVSLCRYPAYEQAQVLAVRTEPVVMEPVAVASELAERLEALGVEALSRIAITKKPWDGSASRFTDEEYQRSCLIDRGGDATVKERCSLPVLEPNGDLNVNALGAAAGRLYQVGNVSRAQKAAAARKLVRYYRLATMTPPTTVVSLAQS